MALALKLLHLQIMPSLCEIGFALTIHFVECYLEVCQLEVTHDAIATNFASSFYSLPKGCNMHNVGYSLGCIDKSMLES